MDEKIRQIREFLIRFKALATTDRGIDVIPRLPNNQALADLGLTKGNRHEEILALSAEDYCKGPEPDADRPGEVWVFGKTINDRSVYIKLKIANVGAGVEIAKCISFHEAQFPLSFPCKRDKGGVK